MTSVDVAAVIFDWGGTITPWHDIDPIAQWLAAVGDDAAAQRLHEASETIWVRSRDEHRSATLDGVFAASGVRATPQMIAAFYEWWEPHTFADPDAFEVFRGLRERGIKVGVLSNTIWSRTEHERIFERDGLAALIDGAVYSCDIPWTKPHPEAFKAALDAVDVDDPSVAVFVGDRLFDDIHGAGSVGMRTILVPHSNIPPEQIGASVGDPDAVAHRLGDVLALVDAWRAGPRALDAEHA
ncbi:MAG: HAD family hydrolase [Jatrophihabitantaceae bacterium]